MVGWDAQANDIFLEALEIDSPQCRSDYLQRACAADKDLRARVERLLAADSNAAHFLESPAFPADLVSLDVPIIEGSGDVIGRYKLLQQIGEGGMGLVFMAEQVSPVRRTVALKICLEVIYNSCLVARVVPSLFVPLSE